MMMLTDSQPCVSNRYELLTSRVCLCSLCELRMRCLLIRVLEIEDCLISGVLMTVGRTFDRNTFDLFSLPAFTTTTTTTISIVNRWVMIIWGSRGHQISYSTETLLFLNIRVDPLCNVALVYHPCSSSVYSPLVGWWWLWMSFLDTHDVWCVLDV